MSAFCFVTITTILSLFVFTSFLVCSFVEFGLLRSYSAYAARWTKEVPIDSHTHLWSIVTIIVAILMCFGTIEAGDESPLQFLGFFAPAYLIVVALTPEWEDQPGDSSEMRKKRKIQRTIHYIGTALCASCALCWFFFTLRLWFYPFVSLGVFLLVAVFTKTLKKSYVYWLEMTLFYATYAALLIPSIIRLCVK